MIDEIGSSDDSVSLGLLFISTFVLLAGSLPLESEMFSSSSHMGKLGLGGSAPQLTKAQCPLDGRGTSYCSQILTILC
jgi:hypothetical protein